MIARILSDPDMVIALIAFLVAAAFAVHLAIVRERVHKERLAVLRLVEELTDEAFDALDELASDPATPSSLIRFGHYIAGAMGTRAAALSYFVYQRDLQSGKQPQAANHALRSALQKLAGRPDLLEHLAIFLSNAQLVTLLRWKETQAIGLERMRTAFIERQKHIQMPKESKSKQIDKIEIIAADIIGGTKEKNHVRELAFA